MASTPLNSPIVYESVNCMTYINGLDFLNGIIQSTNLTRDYVKRSIVSCHEVDKKIEVLFKSDSIRDEWIDQNKTIMVKGFEFKIESPDTVTVHIHRAPLDMENSKIVTFLEKFGTVKTDMQRLFYAGEWNTIENGSRKIVMYRLKSKAGIPRYKYFDGRKIKFMHRNQISNLNERARILKEEKPKLNDDTTDNLDINFSTEKPRNNAEHSPEFVPRTPSDNLLHSTLDNSISDNSSLMTSPGKHPLINSPEPQTVARDEYNLSTFSTFNQDELSNLNPFDVPKIEKTDDDDDHKKWLKRRDMEDRSHRDKMTLKEKDT